MIGEMNLQTCLASSCLPQEAPMYSQLSLIKQYVASSDLFAINAILYGVTCDRTESKNCPPISRARRRPKKHRGNDLSRVISRVSSLRAIVSPSAGFFLRIDGLMQMYRAAEFFNIAHKSSEDRISPPGFSARRFQFENHISTIFFKIARITSKRFILRQEPAVLLLKIVGIIKNV